MALAIASLSLWDSHRKGELLKDIAKSLKYIARQPRLANQPRKTTGPTNAVLDAQKIQLKQQQEERRRLKDDLERQKAAWRRQKDVAKAIGWIIDKINADDNED